MLSEQGRGQVQDKGQVPDKEPVPEEHKGLEQVSRRSPLAGRGRGSCRGPCSARTRTRPCHSPPAQGTLYVVKEIKIKDTFGAGNLKYIFGFVTLGKI